MKKGGLNLAMWNIVVAALGFSAPVPRVKAVPVVKHMETWCPDCGQFSVGRLCPHCNRLK